MKPPIKCGQSYNVVPWRPAKDDLHILRVKVSWPARFIAETKAIDLEEPRPDIRVSTNSSSIHRLLMILPMCA
jgi:hypothetical protein